MSNKIFTGKIFSYLLLASSLLISTAEVQAQHANYKLAAKFSPQKQKKMVFSTSVDAHWLKQSDRFWYEYETTDGKNWYIVNPATASKKLMFDRVKLAAELTRIVRDPFDAQHLPIDSLKFIKDERTIQFQVKSSIEEEIKPDSAAAKKDSTDKKSAEKKAKPKKQKKTFYFEYNLDSQQLTELTDFKRPKKRPGWASISPDQQTIVFAREFNLYWMDKANYEKALQNEDDSTIVEHAITKDGVDNYAYGGDEYSSLNTESKKDKKKRKSARILWSPGSDYFVLNRVDKRDVKDLWVINSIADPRPTLETYKYQMPGEKEAPIQHILIFDNKTKTSQEVPLVHFKNQDVSIWSGPRKKSDRDDEWHPYVWHGTNNYFYLTRTSRDLKRIDVMKVDAKTASASTVIEERLNTYVETRRVGLVNGGKELIQWSEQDGWAHFYLYDENGKLKNQVTQGAYHCEDIVNIDEKNRVLYFTANGREAGEDPYYMHLYRVNFDGSNLKLLNKGDFDHNMSLDDNNKFFVDNYSRVNTTPQSALYNNEGKKIMDLETADLKNLFAVGYKFPEIFKVKADDGITDLYGVMYKPFDFDSTKKYPVVEYVYPGPQTEAVNKSFSKVADRTDRLAQIGLIVVTVGNRGGHPSRSKWYHNYGYGNLRDYGLADKKAAIEQLADRYDFIDIDRVGIHGHSGGGFMSTAAMLVYPDFFKVAVSSSGNHDNSIYNRWWSEKHHGVQEHITEKGDTTFLYNIEKNPDLAKNLKGHLMLTTGDIDNNVHPANTVRVINALIKANKRFDFLLLPGQRHGYGNMQEWFFWNLADYYSRWLLGDFSQPVNMIEIQKDIPQTRG
ncbi:S9 family peptidase [Chitinophaga caeni]|uniref:S9 family peptidase n=1 Tax=Chitinophaga caeni TaxID=2029983 RepID=A0A291QXB1_9BACT|nr:DPP IV N-terminal domain-containing protein [Chitinophaga caeni]ATL48567.1 S9 family peptidase [Chitinophaga caeni]